MGRSTKGVMEMVENNLIEIVEAIYELTKAVKQLTEEVIKLGENV